MSSATEDKNISGGVKRRTSSKKHKTNEKQKQRTTTYTFLDDDDDEEEEEDLEMSHQVSGNWESFALNSLLPATYTNLKNAHLLTKSPDHSKAPGGSPTAISLSGTTGPTGVVGLLQKPPSMSLDLGAPPVPTSNSNPYSDSSLSTHQLQDQERQIQVILCERGIGGGGCEAGEGICGLKNISHRQVSGFCIYAEHIRSEPC